MNTPFRAACIQFNTGNELDRNLAVLKEMAGEAAGKGAKLVLTPEYSLMMDGSGRVMRENALAADGGSALSELQALSRELQIWLLVGSLTLKTDEERIINRSFLITAEGIVAAIYDKIHMFDVTLPDGKMIRESSTYRPGERAVIAEIPWGKLGITVCYDLRFPHLYRALAQQGAEFIAVPSSFQRQTGKAHWHTLLKARAIENAAYIFAPAMCGEHAGNRQTYGHALIVDPWGEVLADAGDEPGIVYADIEPARVAKIRSMMPSLTHDRPYTVGVSAST